MSWKEAVLAVHTRFGASVRPAVKLVLDALLPGGPAVVELVGHAIACGGESPRANLVIDESRLPPVTSADLTRVDELLRVLAGDLAGLTEQAAALQTVPHLAATVLDIALRTDGRCRAAAHKVEALAQGFDVLGWRVAELLAARRGAAAAVDRMAPLLRRAAGAADFVEELCAAGVGGDDFRAALAEFRSGLAAVAAARGAEAAARLERVARARPMSAAAAVALGAAQAAKGDLPGAQKSAVRAARLRPGDAGLAELAQRLAPAAPIVVPPPSPVAHAPGSPRPARPPRQPRTDVDLKAPRKGGAHFVNSLGMTFAWIPPGAFLMGSPDDEPQRRDDEVQHGVTLTKGFWLAIHPVTQTKWEGVMGEDSSRFEGYDRPVEQICWRDATAFCRELSARDSRRYRLPTEAEWEYACRAGTTTAFHFGEAISTDQANYDGNQSYGSGKGVFRKETLPVCSFRPNAWGLFDMHGNVREWCQDWYSGAYPSEDAVDPPGGETGGFRVLRGGSWRDYPSDCRSAARHGRGPAVREDNVGCRVVLDMDAPA